jgi:hypothetical protein
VTKFSRDGRTARRKNRAKKNILKKQHAPRNISSKKKQGENFCENNERAAPDISPRKTRAA